ncbi:DUF5134 domain-containing protein [Kitasatospora sp. NPDC015120]|uniref:DUF5134 domain-containing protein n=1 Tax=Kitasatospora sp. NPDC015120 TaxID=3364023 RepID=UPI0036F468C1
MLEPVIVTVLLIALTGWCAVHCALVIAGRRCADRRLELTEIVMALAMVAMMAPALDPLPQAVWSALLAACAAWSALLLLGRAGRDGHASRAGPGGWQHYPHHALSAAAMAVLVLPLAPAHHHARGAAHPGAAAVPEWTLLALAAYFLAHAACGAGAMLPRPADAARHAGARPLFGPAAPSPRLAAARQSVMSIGMVYMLLGMS